MDHYVKKQVLYDTVELMLQGRQLGGVFFLGRYFRSLIRIHPSEDANNRELYKNLKELRHYFFSITKGQYAI